MEYLTFALPSDLTYGRTSWAIHYLILLDFSSVSFAFGHDTLVYFTIISLLVWKHMQGKRSQDGSAHVTDL